MISRDKWPEWLDPFDAVMAVLVGLTLLGIAINLTFELG